MSPYLARGFDILQKPENLKLKEPVEVKSIRDAFGQGALDEEWIPLAGQAGSCVITQDFNIQRIRHQRELCESYGLGLFYFRPPSRNGFRYWDMLTLMVKHWPDMSKKQSWRKNHLRIRLHPEVKDWWSYRNNTILHVTL